VREKYSMPTKDEIRDFSVLIEELATKLRCTRMDAILEHCKETGLEIEVASTLISSALKARIREEAQENNMLKKTSKLPL
jgi:hypothetical protein